MIFSPVITKAICTKAYAENTEKPREQKLPHVHLQGQRRLTYGPMSFLSPPFSHHSTCNPLLCLSQF